MIFFLALSQRSLKNKVEYFKCNSGTKWTLYKGEIDNEIYIEIWEVLVRPWVKLSWFPSNFKHPFLFWFCSPCIHSTPSAKSPLPDSYKLHSRESAIISRLYSCLPLFEKLFLWMSTWPSLELPPTSLLNVHAQWLSYYPVGFGATFTWICILPLVLVSYVLVILNNYSTLFFLIRNKL